MKLLNRYLFPIIIFLSYAGYAQYKTITVSGTIKAEATNFVVPFANISLTKNTSNAPVIGSISNEDGLFTLAGISPGNYTLQIKYLGFADYNKPVYIGSLSEFINLGQIILTEESTTLNEVMVNGSVDAVNDRMDKKSYTVAHNITQAGGSVLQVMQNLPGITTQDGKVQLRGNDKVMILVDGKQTAITGFNGQYGLDNIPASAIEKIEIINNPSAKYEANGNAGIINIIYKKNNSEGLNGKVGLGAGLGALWQRKDNLPTIRPQYKMTPKINPSFALNYKKDKINAFFQGDYLYTETLNKNEFVTRTYDDGTIINQQTKRNRNTHFTNIKTGLDWEYNLRNTLSISALFGSEKILDNGDEPFFNSNYSERLRLWQFLEDELKTTIMASASYQHKFKDPGHLFNLTTNYTFHRENEKYFFDNIMPTYTGHDAFKLLSDENVLDVNADYIKPLKYGRIETGVKLRNRIIPTNMQFYPGINSPLDASAGGKATYKETIPAAYGNYAYESNKLETEVGLRLEYLNLNYTVNPNHPVYKSNGYAYFKPFPTLRLAYKINENNKLSFFYNRRIDRPNEVDIRVFPKYDDAEIIKVGNPALRPQYTNSLEIGYKATIGNGYFYASAYSKFVNGTITRIATTTPDSNIIYNIFENAGNSNMTGIEAVFSYKPANWYNFNINSNIYSNTINAFSVSLLYPTTTQFSANKNQITSGSLKWNNTFTFSKTLTGQLLATYLAPDIIPQGKIGSRFATDLGIKKTTQKGRGEIYLNATDIFNILVPKRTIIANGFSYTSTDYYETQVIRFGYNYKF